MVDLDDELIDALGDVAPQLVRVAELALEGLDALHLGPELLAKQPVLLAEPVARFDQRADRTLQAIEIEGRIRLDDLDLRVSDQVGNVPPPTVTDRTGLGRNPSRNARVPDSSEVAIGARSRKQNAGWLGACGSTLPTAAAPVRSDGCERRS